MRRGKECSPLAPDPRSVEAGGKCYGMDVEGRDVPHHIDPAERRRILQQAAVRRERFLRSELATPGVGDVPELRTCLQQELEQVAPPGRHSLALQRTQAAADARS